MARQEWIPGLGSGFPMSAVRGKHPIAGLVEEVARYVRLATFPLVHVKMGLKPSM